MARIFDPKLVNPIIVSAVEELITNKGGLASTKPFDLEARPIEEYEGRMRVNATDNFDVAVFIGVVNLYLNKGDLSAHRSRGAMIFYLVTEVADKIFKAAGLQVPYDEDDESMMSLFGNFCQSIANAVRDRFVSEGYVSLEVSKPAIYKNTVAEGVEFSRDQEEKQEISFYFLKRKAMAIDWTLAPLPKK